METSSVRGFRPDWTRATGNQIGLAFECESAAEVDAAYGLERAEPLAKLMGLDHGVSLRGGAVRVGGT